MVRRSEMPVNIMKNLSRNDIEIMADRVLSQYLTEKKRLKEEVFRIDPEDLAAKLYGIQFDYRKLSKSGMILGMTSFSHAGVLVWDADNNPEYYFLSEKDILIDSALLEKGQEGRCNFTKMHELAHQIFGRLYPNDYAVRYRKEPLIYYRSEEIRKGKVTNWEEWQANVLASFLLLPEELVEICLQSFGLAPRIRYMSKSTTPKEYEKFCKMAEHLGVSKQALAIRLKQLGHIENDTLQRPGWLRSVEMEDEEWNCLQTM